MQHLMRAAAVSLLVVCLAGCDPIPGDGTGIEGKWQGDIEQLLELTGELPIPVGVDATLTFDGGALTANLSTDIPVISCATRLLIHGTYENQDQTPLKKLDLNINKIEARVLFINIPVGDFTLSTTAIYTIENNDVLYLVPEWQRIPQEIRDYYEEFPELFPWEGTRVGDREIRPIKLNRVR